jgi:hypothetical protein
MGKKKKSVMWDSTPSTNEALFESMVNPPTDEKKKKKDEEED